MNTTTLHPASELSPMRRHYQRIVSLECRNASALRDYYVRFQVWDNNTCDFDSFEYCVTVPMGLGEYQKVSNLVESLGAINAAFIIKDAMDEDARLHKYAAKYIADEVI